MHTLVLSQNGNYIQLEKMTKFSTTYSKRTKKILIQPYHQQCLDNPITDGSKADSPKHQPHSTPQKHYFSASGTHFCYRLSKHQGLVWPKIRKIEKNSFTSSGLKPETFRLVA
jgi:hypothetical protein